MNGYRVTLRLQSALGTPLAADTLFGHICWGMRYYQGEATLERFLAAMESEQPPLLISDPMPAGFLPMPELPPLNPQERSEILDRIEHMTWAELRDRLHTQIQPGLPGCPNSAEAYGLLKTVLDRQCLPRQIFQDLQSDLSLYRCILKLLEQFIPVPTEPEVMVAAHNTVDRIRGGTVKGALYFLEDEFVHPDARDYDLYILAHEKEYDREKILSLLHHALDGGYGRDKSVGKGVIEIVKEEVEDWLPPSCETPSGVMLLGPCAPQESDPTDGFWRLSSKAGKLGGDWAVGHTNPSKKTVTMLTRGSILLTDTPKSWYGRMVDQVHDIEAVRHYGLALALPVHIQGLETLP